ncbi:MAG: cobalamin biosynthesis protein, partial [Synergistaceae bacterium]|nr:cobalamin biosynthesis protein [Synergistaceae bacterium]
IDEAGNFVIPILSGHVGGANELAKKIAAFLHAVPVITTATDVNNLIAVDEWAVKNNCAIENPNAIKKISSEILEHHSVGVAVTNELQPAPFPVTLFLRPKNLILGAGCNRGISEKEFENASKIFLESSGVSALSLKALASIDIKSNEPALINFAKNHNIPFVTFTASELQELKGNFTSSEKVLKVTGVDNICERACILAGSEGAVLLRSKWIYKKDITLALARVLYT